MASVGLPEEEDNLDPNPIDLHRAMVSLMEEPEAVDWYQQRADARTDAQFKAILEHNRDDELEQAAMVLEWIRRRTPGMDRFVRTYLFTDGDITRIEKAAK